MSRSPKSNKRFTVRKRDAKKRLKIVRDRETELTMERVRARADRKCQNEVCSYFMSIISGGKDYAKVLNPDKAGPLVRGQIMPVFEDFHFECVPERAKPLVEFFAGDIEVQDE